MGEVTRSTLMIRKGPYKLMLHKMASSHRLDMLINLTADPYELNNLVGEKGMTGDDDILSKAEHLRCLLLESMRRMDGNVGYYSDPTGNFGEGDSDITEVLLTVKPGASWISGLATCISSLYRLFGMDRDILETNSCIWAEGQQGHSEFRPLL
jgi:hypothetical protein